MLEPQLLEPRLRSEALIAVAEAERPSLYVNDKVHLAPTGHERVADAVLRAIENAGL